MNHRRKTMMDDHSWLNRMPALIRKWTGALWPAAKFVLWCWHEYQAVR
jgi:hypothetical protein